jgi:hypothetical protein
MDILVDFDGTCVMHEYPRVGKDNPNCVKVLKDLVKAGHKIIIFTMRSGKTLDDAVKWYEKHDIKVYGVNTNPTQKSWTASPKAYGQLIVDDISLGIPLVENENERPYVDWYGVEELLKEKNIL